MIKVLFFAKLSEQLGLRELQVAADTVQDTDQLLAYLMNQKPEWSVILTDQSWLKAVNQAMTTGNESLSAGDEVAYFPPVTGG